MLAFKESRASAPLPYASGNNITGENSYRRYFLPRIKITNYNIEIDGRNFYDQPINDSIKQYDEVRKISTGKGDDYITGCLLDFAYFEKNYRKIAADLSKQKALDADSRAIQQIIFTGHTNAQIKDLLYSRAIKRNNTRIFKRNNKSSVSKYNVNVNQKILSRSLSLSFSFSLSLSLSFSFSL